MVRRLESWISGLADVNPPGDPGIYNPWFRGGFWTRGLCPECFYVRQSWNLAFRSVTENDILLCSNATGSYVMGISSGLATDRGFWPRGVMSANHIGYRTRQSVSLARPCSWTLKCIQSLRKCWVYAMLSACRSAVQPLHSPYSTYRASVRRPPNTVHVNGELL